MTTEYRSWNRDSSFLKRSTFSLLISGLLLSPGVSYSQALNQNCTVNILNRTVSVDANGGWSLPNVPANVGQIRARATCVENGSVSVGQSDYFTVIENSVNQVPEIRFDAYREAPESLSISATQQTLSSLNDVATLSVVAQFADGTTADVSLSTSGINYRSSSNSIATVNADGLVNAVSTGNVLITARKDGVLVLFPLSVSLSGDQDGDGLPDDYEVANGLDPNDPFDALEDKDSDGVSALDEFAAGSEINNPDTDGDGLSDGEELTAGEDGFITNPVLADSDGDGISDGLEALVGTNPNDINSGSLADVLESITASPQSLNIVFNQIDGEASKQLTVTGTLIDGSEIDLTDTSTGTSYISTDITIANLGIESGLIFAGLSGGTTITISNNGFKTVVPVTVDLFQAQALSVLQLSGSLFNTLVVGNIAYVASGNSGLALVDVADRTNPQIINTITTTNSTRDVHVRDNLIYTAEGIGGIRVLDATDLTNPTVITQLTLPGTAQSLHQFDNRLYVGAGTAGVHILDISNPGVPVFVLTVDTLGNAKDVFANGVHLAVITDRLEVYAIANLSSVQFHGSVVTGLPSAVALKGDIALIADRNSSLVSIDISRANDLRTLDNTTRSSVGLLTDLEVIGDLAFASDTVFLNEAPVINIADPQNLTRALIINFSQFSITDGRSIAADSAYIYLASVNSKLFIGQYRNLIDNAGIAPQISQLLPIDGAAGFFGGTMKVAVQASDDILVERVIFSLNGEILDQIETPPYIITLDMPIDQPQVIVTAQAFDLGDNPSELLEIVIPVVPDTDHDGLSDDSETNVYGTDPLVADTDGDSYLDGFEVFNHLNPLSADTDSDGLSEQEELEAGVDGYITNPRIVDTDSDGLSDWWESTHSGSPLFQDPTNASDANADFDGDGLTTFEEFLFGSNPALADSDGDGIDDFLERDLGTNPLVANNLPVAVNSSAIAYINTKTLDSDSDGIANRDELQLGTNPGSAASAPNYSIDSLRIAYINQAFIDTDGDGYSDLDENLLGTDPTSAGSTPATKVDSNFIAFINQGLTDSDKDGYTDLEEILLGTDPASASSRPETRLSSTTVAFLNRQLTDSDGDGISDRDEIMTQTDPQDASSRIPNTTQSSLVAWFNDHSLIISSTALAVENTAVTATSEVISALHQLLYSNNIADTQSPELLLITPTHGSTDVGAHGTVTLTFSESVEPVSINGNTLSLKIGGESVPYQFVRSADNRAVTILAPLAEGSEVVVTVGGITDLFGNSMTTTVATFNTGSGINPQPTVVSQRPSNSSGGIISSAAINVVGNLTFDESSLINGLSILINGVEASGNFLLQDNGKTIAFTPDAPWPAGSLVEVHLENVTDSNGHAFHNYAGSFRIAEDAAISTPQIVDYSPQATAEAIPLNVVIDIGFSKSLDQASVDSTSVGLMENDTESSLLSSIIEIKNTSTVRLTPDTPLQSSTDYVVGTTSAIRSTDQQLATDFTRVMITGDSEDLLAPELINVQPADGSTNGTNVQIWLTFSEAINPLSINSSTLQWLDSTASPIQYSTRFSQNHRTVGLVAGHLLTANSNYTLSLNGVEDLAGNAISTGTSQFYTSNGPDITAPLLDSASYLVDGDGNSLVNVMFSEELNLLSVREDILYLLDSSGVRIDGTWTASSAANLVFYANNLLAPGQIYELHYGYGLNDLAGNKLQDGSTPVIP